VGPSPAARLWGNLLFLDVETEKAGVFLLTQVNIAGAGAPAGHVVAGAGIGAEDFQNVAGIKLVHFLLGAQQGHGAAQTLGVEGAGGGDAFRGSFGLAHGFLHLN